MERRKFMTRLGAGTAVCTAMPLLSAGMEMSSGSLNSSLPPTGEIQHMVIFDLMHAKGSAQAEKFLHDGRQILTKIPVVRNFRVFNQVSLKNDYTYGFSMVFAGQSDYETYNNHPDHVAFVENRWKKEVTRFLEIDFTPHQTA